MDSLGEKLKEARAERGFSVDQVSRDTNISKEFILALENEDFERFPGEPYVVGFIRNYAEYLGFKGEEFIQLYKNIKIQEQPIPMEELVIAKKNKGKLVSIIAGIIALCFVFLGIFFLVGIFSKNSKKKKDLSPLPRRGDIYEFNASRELLEVKAEDSVSLSEAMSGEDFLIRVEGIDSQKKLAWFTASNSKGETQPIVEIGLKAYTIFDLNKDGIGDVQLTLMDIGKEKLTIDLNRNFKGVAKFFLRDSILKKDFFSEIDSEEKLFVLETATAKSDFKVMIKSTGPAVFFYRIDGGEEQQFSEKISGQENILIIKNGALFWCSNRFGLTMKVNDKIFAIPEQGGPSASFFISWYQVEGKNEFKLVAHVLDIVNE